MDPALVPNTAPGRQLAWLMSLETEPPAGEIAAHLEPAAAGEVHADLPPLAAGGPGLARGLLAFGTMVRGLPGAVTQSDDAMVRLQLAHGGRVLDVVVSTGHGGSGKSRSFA